MSLRRGTASSLLPAGAILTVSLCETVSAASHEPFRTNFRKVFNDLGSSFQTLEDNIAYPVNSYTDTVERAEGVSYRVRGQMDAAE